MPTEKPLKTAEAAAYLGVSTFSIRRWAKDKRLRYMTTPGGQMRFTRADLDAVMRTHEPAA